MPHPLTADQQDEFARRGVLSLPGFFPTADIAIMRDRLWADLETRYGLMRRDASSWPTSPPSQFQTLRRSGAFAALASPKLFALADALIGPGRWAAPEHWGAPLVTFPSLAPVLPRPPWHLDIGGQEPLSPLPTLRIFTFLEPVGARGGGTLYVAGSHHHALACERFHGAPVRSAQVRDWLKRHPWFDRLLATPTESLRCLIDVEAQIGAHAVALGEMTGQPGDLIIMHPALLHAPNHNGCDRPRMMLTDSLHRRRRVVARGRGEAHGRPDHDIFVSR
jgi:hypothetical protein